MANKKRVFLAVSLEKPIIFSLRKGIAKFKKKTRKISSLIRWLPEENFHLTIIFFGYLSLPEIGIVREEAKKIFVSQEIFNLFFERICFAPEKKFAKMIWWKGKKSLELEKIRKELTGKLLNRGLSFSTNNRPLVPHITLARLKKILPRTTESYSCKAVDECISKDLKGIPQSHRCKPMVRGLPGAPDISEEFNQEFSVKKIDLVESKLSPQGARYYLLESFPLKDKRKANVAQSAEQLHGKE